jgi:hypothetical protein
MKFPHALFIVLFFVFSNLSDILKKTEKRAKK